MIKFTIFGIPVTVEPWFWAVGFFLGSGFHHLQHGTYEYIATWLVIIFFSILVHELGHAIVGHKLGGGSVWIRLWAFGGLAYHEAGRISLKNKRLRIAAGPAAGLCLFIVTVILMLIIWPGQTGRDLVGLAIGYKDFSITELSPEAISILSTTYIKFYIFNQLIWINLWWSLVNLLPIYPLDGGQLADSFMKSRKKMFLLSMITAVLVILVVGLTTKSPFIIAMFAFFAFQSYQGYEKSPY